MFYSLCQTDSFGMIVFSFGSIIFESEIKNFKRFTTGICQINSYLDCETGKI